MAKSPIAGLFGMSEAAVEVTKISGREVPMDTMVNPMTTSGRPARYARPLAPSMKTSADLISNARAMLSSTRETQLLLMVESSRTV